MDQSFVVAWLTRHLRKQASASLFLGVLCLLGGLAILLVTWGLVYAVSLFALGPWIGYRHWLHSVAGWIMLPALFWGNARTSREYLSEYSVTVGTASDQVVNFYLPGVGMTSSVNPLAPETIHTGVKMITDCLYSGPRVVIAGFRNLAKARRLKAVDAVACGAVIAGLLAAGRKLSFQDIINQVGEIDPGKIFNQLREVEGVIFLAGPPAGLTLSQDLRQELLELMRYA